MLDFSKRIKFRITSLWRATSLFGICVTLLLITTSITQASSAWTLRTSTTTQQQRSVTFRSSQFVSAGWNALVGASGTGTSGVVNALDLNSGKLYVGGSFVNAGGITANSVAQWDGTNWSAFSGPSATGLASGGNITGLKVDSTGQLFVVGGFNTIGGLPGAFRGNGAKWDGSAWVWLQSGSTPLVVSAAASAVTFDGSGAAYIGGLFIVAGNASLSANGVAKFAGTVVSNLKDATTNIVGANSGTDVRTLVLDSSNNVYIGGAFTAAGGVANTARIAKYDGTHWLPLGLGIDNGLVSAMTFDNLGNLYVGGTFTSINGGVPASGIAKWDGTTWTALGSGVTGGGVNALVTDPSGKLYVGGSFTSAGGVSNTGKLAVWNGSWQALSKGTPNGAVNALLYDATNHYLYVGGSFTTAGSPAVTVNNVAFYQLTPEIDLRGNNISIVNGDTTPSSVDGTAFGSVNTSNSTVIRTFTIQNTDIGPLSVSTPTLSGANAGDFAITSVPTSSVAGGGSTTFQITFDPAAAGTRTATVAIGNDDSDENPYTFAIQGVGVLPAPSLSIPTSQRDAAQGTFSVPVNFTSDGASIAAIGFVLNYDQTCLSIAATDSNSDGIPDAITGLPNGFIPSITHDALAGALNIALVDNTAPIGALSDGALLTVAFTVKPACVTTDGSTHSVTLSFATDPAPSFSDALGNDVNGTSTGATIPLHFNATPTAITLSNSSVAENAASGTTVGTLSTTDLDISDTHTYTLVSGTGDTDNASFTLTGNTLKTATSFDFETKNSYSIRVRTTDNGGPNGTFEQALTVSVTNVNEAPTAVDDPSDPVTTVFVGGQATTIDVLANDTDPEHDSLSVQSVNPTGTQGSVTNNSTTVSYTAPNSNGSSSFTYQASDGALTSNNATVQTTYVKNDARGDCNGNGSISAGDFIATVLEIFDTNDTKYNTNPAWWLTYTGDYAGSPRGCDANAGQNGQNHTSDSVSAGDIICTVLIFFKQPCGAVVAASPATTPQVAVADTSATLGQTAKVAVNLTTASNAVAAATFALVVDQSKLTFDATDADGDGVPDAVTIRIPASMSKRVTWNAAQSRLEVAVFGVSLPLPTLTDGPLATVNFQVAANATPGTTALSLQLVSLSDTTGQDLTVDQSNGTLTITANTARALLYLPVVVR